MPDVELKEELITKMRSFYQKAYQQEINKSIEKNTSVDIDFNRLDKFNKPLCDTLLHKPDFFLDTANQAFKAEYPESKNKIRLFNVPDVVSIRNLRTKHMGKLISIEGMVKKASEIRPEIVCGIWECQDCGQTFSQPRKGAFIFEPTKCPFPECKSKDLKQKDSENIDVRWITLEEPYELAEGDKPSQVLVYISEDLVSPDNRRMSDVGNRVKITGIMREVPKGKSTSVKLDFYLDANHIEAVEMGWERVEISKEDEAEIKRLASDDKIYDIFIESLAPSIFGLNEIKESIILQIFGGVQRTLKDKVKFRGDIHILLIGDAGCIIGDERVIMADGTVMKIEEMGKNHLDNIDYQVHVGKGSVRGQATQFHYYKNMPIIEIITETGKSLKGTYNQMVLTRKDGEQIWRRLDEIKTGERVCIIPKIENKKTELIKTEWKEPIYFHKSWHIKIPETVDEKLAAIFGYVMGDGWIRKRSLGFIINKKKKDISPILIQYFKDCFDSPVAERKQQNDKITVYEVDRTHIANILSFLKNRRVPNYIWQSRNSVVASYLSWLYEADGCAFSGGRGRTAVSFKSSRLEFLRDIQILLLRFGIQSRILWRENVGKSKIKGRIVNSKGCGDLVIRRSESIIKFSENIGFIGNDKKERLQKAVEYAKKPKHHIHSTTKRTEYVKEIIFHEPQDVYDIVVPEHERFVANGIVIHNTGKSQILKLVPEIVPRGRYVSGKGTSTAGLTASVTKDEVFGWTLEAGAIVLANKGILAVDEFEKMSNEDQVAFHEALEQGSVSISKATITTTLPARTSVIAGGNPKLGRFDKYQSIAKQITIPDTLLSRFDLKFALLDKPSEENDERTAEHILKSRNGDKDILPKLSPEFIRRYVAYAKENCKPEFTPETSKVIKSFYVGIRKRAEGKNTVPITLRQFEAMLRLAEASAKVQLSPTVRIEDSERAIRLMTHSLRQLGLDPETNEIDIDRASGGIPSSERGKIRYLIKIIQAKFYDQKEISIRELKEESERLGLHEIDDAIEQLLKNGEYYKPTPGILARV